MNQGPRIAFQIYERQPKSNHPEENHKDKLEGGRGREGWGGGRVGGRGGRGGGRGGGCQSEVKDDDNNEIRRMKRKRSEEEDLMNIEAKVDKVISAMKLVPPKRKDTSEEYQFEAGLCAREPKSE